MRGPAADPTGYGTGFQIFGNTLTGNTGIKHDTLANVLDTYPNNIQGVSVAEKYLALIPAMPFEEPLGHDTKLIERVRYIRSPQTREENSRLSQSFIESQVEKISDLRRLCAEKGVNPWIEVDGGVGPKNAYKVIEAGANALVAGSAVFGAKDYAKGMDSF
ncbi:hypothetical protein RHMOL_Rhmol09G0063700 [Rhododendron molle]|uniref:Uncharacterized protein n=1 Tax=Rhododendron molle TaxID=49168 RepID=A0ACC0MAG5_RHOML|nr:hypothetical protein RHMOL_Rhmol09G0063700 [Rhododendron molle]